MNKDVSLISMHPFFQRFAFSVVQNIKAKNFSHEDRVVVDADLVPGASEQVMMASMSVETVAPVIKKPEMKPMPIIRDRSRLVAPIRVMPRRQIVAPPVQVVSERVVELAPPVVVHSGLVDGSDRYGKLTPLLNDSSISTIECLGEDKELMIIRAGQKNKTRISLNRVEIQSFLEEVANEAHIPLMEGIFRASIRGFSISAVISDMIGSKFVIKKSTAYGLLE